MRDRSARLALEQMRDTIALLDDYLAGKARDDYAREPMLRHAVERCIEIVSEASRHIPAKRKAAHPEIPWRNLAGIGNVLRHGYRLVDDAMIWSVVRDDLPVLRVAVEAMRQELQQEGSG